MQLIPVMDLQDGVVVRAIAGERARYLPVHSRIVDSASPRIVARALLALAPFRVLYVADLDAITRGGSDRHREVLIALATELGAVGVGELWLDAGRATWVEALEPAVAAYGVRLVRVVGSESLVDASPPEVARRLEAGDGPVLSLDFRHGVLQGPAGLDEQPQRWPSRVIVMELSVVGTGQGPAWPQYDRLARLAIAAGRNDVALYAAGGVRNADDLHALARRGAAGVLLASALHDAALDAATLTAYTRRK